MAGITRANLVKGPARALYTYDPDASPSPLTATFFSKDDFTIVPNLDRFQIRTSAHGIVDERKLHKYVRTSLVPDGRWNDDLIAALWPHSGAVIKPGTSIYNGSAGSDKTLVFHGADLSLTTIHAAGVRQMPDILFSAKETLVGSVEFGGVLADGLDWNDASNLMTYAASGGTFTDSGFAANIIKTQRYTLGLSGLTGFTTAIESLDGWRVGFQQNLKSWEPDGIGLMDESFVDLVVTVTGIPIGPTALELITALRLATAGEGRGNTFADGAGILTIDGEDTITYLTIPKANIFAGGIGYGGQILRNGEVQFVAIRTFSSGDPAALFTLAAS